jgi:eukaryotic-like serine/threonine-protein kinase
MDLEPHQLVAGRYRVERRLAAGQMGEVWTGVHVGIGIRVAIKRMLPATHANHEMVARFKREAYLLGRVRSDYVARVVDFVEDETYGLVLVMELVEGPSLLDLLQLRPIGLDRALSFGRDLLNGLADLHAVQVIHRDLKPGNVIVESRPRGGERAVIVDFGMGRVVTRGGDEEITGITQAGMAMGTLEYMPPEQMLDSRAATPLGDIYAMGAILYRAVAGRHAYVADTDSHLARAKLMEEAPPLPPFDDAAYPAFAALVARALRRKPAERFQSAEEMLSALERVRPAEMPFDEETTTNTSSSAMIAAVAAAMPARIEKPERAIELPKAPPVAPPAVVQAPPQAPREEAPSKRGPWPFVAVTAVALAGVTAMLLGRDRESRGVEKARRDVASVSTIDAAAPTVSGTAAAASPVASAPAAGLAIDAGSGQASAALPGASASASANTPVLDVDQLGSAGDPVATVPRKWAATRVVSGSSSSAAAVPPMARSSPTAASPSPASSDGF